MAELKSLIVNGVSRLNSTAYAKNIYADKFITNGGSASQFVKGDGTLDSTSYSPTSHTHSYLPLSGGQLTGTLLVKTSTSNWTEGIRLLDSTNGWTTLAMGGSASSGTGENTWTMHTYQGAYYLALNGSSSYTYGLTWTKAGALSIKTSSFTNNGNTIWHAGNDGSGSGLDADLLDGNHASAFATSGHNHDSTYLKLAGGTMTGTLYTASNIYNTIDGSNSGVGAIHMNNSDITGVNAILTADLSDSWKESIAFARSNGNWDTFRAADGTFYFGVNSGTEYTAIHSGNYTSYVNTTNFPGLNKTGTVTSVAVSNGGGLSISGSPITTSGTITISHSNSVTAQATQALYPIKIDANGHISAYGTAVTSLPASDVYAWAKASTKPSYTLDEVSDGSSRKLANYLPLAGGTMTGAAPINFTANTVQMNFRPGHDSYNSKVEYMTSGNEALVFANCAAVTSFIFATGLNLTNRSDYNGLGTVAMQIKSNKVSINRAVRPDTDPQTETLYIGGTTRVASNDFYVGTASGSQCHQQYDSTTKCLKFVFD